jgi:adenylosuccinate synthase
MRISKSSRIKNQLKKILKPHKNLVVVGGNFGDEGKGKIIDLIMEHYDLTVRFGGGANAGHTVQTPQGVKIVSHLIPCGLAQNKVCVLGRGELLDLRLFAEELKAAKKIFRGKLPEIWLDEMSPIFTPYHALLEAWLELNLGLGKVGTTGKGIGPLEGLHVFRISPVLGQVLLQKEKLVEALEILRRELLPILQIMKTRVPEAKLPTATAAAGELLKYRALIKDRVIDTSYLLNRSFKQGKRMLFEGSQALGLDNHWGTYPFVTSGNTVAAGASLGTGLPMQAFDAALMVAKTLPTRVGQGPFVSEMWERGKAMAFAKEHAELFKSGMERARFLSQKLRKLNAGKANRAEMSQYFQVLGDERGATTGRGRSLGFLDIPWLLYACRINRPTFLALTRFDMLSKIKSIPVVVAYKYQGKIFPPGKLPPPWVLPKVQPVFRQWEGFAQDIAGINEENRLPQSARDFISRLESRLKLPILLVGTGPGREDIVVRSGPH